MSVTAAHATRHIATSDRTFTAVVLRAALRQRTLLLAVTLGFPIFFYTFLLALMVLRFGDLPNYITPYNWIGGVSRIVASTGSIADMLPIVLNEWLLEVGYMNYAYGHGVSEWSLLIIPHKLLFVALIGALIGLNFAVIADRVADEPSVHERLCIVRCGVMTGVGALCASLLGITLFWVVCHSSPSWVVSLAILGVEVSTSLALEPIGPAISLAGIVLLVVSLCLTARDKRQSEAPMPWRAKEPAPC